MIAAAPILASGKLPVNWFDLALALVLGFGFWRGRKHGMSREFLPVTMWLVIVFAAGLGYGLLGDLLIQHNVISSVFGKTFNVTTASYVTAYLLILTTVVILFVFPRRYLKGKLEGSNFFGGGEYYLGIIAGMIRWFCWALVVMALLNAPVYTSAEISAKKAYNNRWFGGGMKDYSGNFFPSLDEVQVMVFKDSFLGPPIKTCVDGLLIHSVPTKDKAPEIEVH